MLAAGNQLGQLDPTSAGTYLADRRRRRYRAEAASMRFIVIQVLEETRTLGGMQVALQSKIKHLDNKSVSQPIVLIIMVLKKLAKEQTRFDYVPEICRRRNAGFKQKSRHVLITCQR